MTDQELSEFSPYFTKAETFLDGIPIDWTQAWYPTMVHLRSLRIQLGEPMRLIRLAHPNRKEAVDGCCPTVPLSRVAMELMRVQGCSWGIYTGNSFHLDTRPFNPFPARWLGIKPQQRKVFEEFGFAHLIAPTPSHITDPEWLYLNWSGERALEAMVLVCRIAEGKEA